MTLITYIAKNFSPAILKLIEQANEVITEYQADGYTLTLRQLFYQLVARGLIPNKVKEYKRLGSAVSDARLAGLISWDAIEDRTRNLETISFWESPQDIVESVARQYKIDLWAPEFQKYRPEVWVEKEALVGVFERPCLRYRVPYIACRGYMSQSEMFAAGQRFREYREEGQMPFILHFGDHDPSGIDMSRDIGDRLELFMSDTDVDVVTAMQGVDFNFERLALNIDQVRKHNPPPNPAKMTDSRVGGYITKFGKESWELDALDPKTLSKLVTDALDNIIDANKWQEAVNKEKEDKRLLLAVSENWDEVTEGL